MSGQPNDLQAWLNQLKKRAEGQSGGQKKAAPQPQQPQPAPEPVARTQPVQQQPRPQPKQKVNYGRPHDIAKAETSRHQEERRMMELEREAEKKRIIAERKRQQQLEQQRILQEQIQKQEEMLRKKKKEKRKARSALGLSGNLMHDLRHNPSSLREAIVLCEILGPPLVDRDPAKRMF
ncbi:MAG: hypothetical protein JXR97_01295 [Planctomycetes bacterium]|nr:hypothetical protein [Planctomycetota bacterium]